MRTWGSELHSNKESCVETDGGTAGEAGRAGFTAGADCMAIGMTIVCEEVVSATQPPASTRRMIAMRIAM